MVKGELFGQGEIEPRYERTGVGFMQATKVFSREFPDAVAANGYTWVYEDFGRLIEKERDALYEENTGVLAVASGRIGDDFLLLPRIPFASARHGSDVVRKRLILPLPTAAIVWQMDSGKIDDREVLSTKHSELFLGAARALLSDNMERHELPADQDLVQFQLNQFLISIRQRGRMYGLEDQAEEYAGKINAYFEQTPKDQFRVVVSGLKNTLELNGEPFLTHYYGADNIVQNLIANTLLPEFLKRMDQKHIWFKVNASELGFKLPPIKDDDKLLEVWRRFGSGKPVRRVIEAYLSGELGKAFLEGISRVEVERIREERFQSSMNDETESVTLDEEPDYSQYTDRTDFGAQEEIEEDPEVVRQARRLKNKKPNERQVED